MARGRHVRGPNDLAPLKCPGCGIPQSWDAFGGIKRKNSWCRSCVADYNSSKNTTEAGRESRLRRYYNLTLKRYLEILARQGGVCGICGDPPPEDTLFHVDHDHSCCSGERTCGLCIRGLLCARCNLGISLMERFPQEVIKWLSL